MKKLLAPWDRTGRHRAGQTVAAYPTGRAL